MTKELTESQACVLEAYRALKAETGLDPSVRALAKRAQFSVSATQHTLLVLRGLRLVPRMRSLREQALDLARQLRERQ